MFFSEGSGKKYEIVAILAMTLFLILMSVLFFSPKVLPGLHRYLFLDQKQKMYASIANGSKILLKKPVKGPAVKSQKNMKKVKKGKAGGFKR